MKQAMFRTSIRTSLRTSLLCTLLLISGTTGFVSGVKNKKKSNKTPEITQPASGIQKHYKLRPQKIHLAPTHQENKVDETKTILDSLATNVARLLPGSAAYGFDKIKNDLNKIIKQSTRNTAKELVRTKLGEILAALRIKYQTFYQENKTGLNRYCSIFTLVAEAYTTISPDATIAPIDSLEKLSPDKQLLQALSALQVFINKEYLADLWKQTRLIPDATLGFFRNLIDKVQEQKKSMSPNDLESFTNDITTKHVPSLTNSIVNARLQYKNKEHADELQKILQGLIDIIVPQENEDLFNDNVGGVVLGYESDKETSESSPKSGSTSPVSTTSSDTTQTNAHLISKGRTDILKNHPKDDMEICKQKTVEQGCQTDNNDDMDISNMKNVVDKAKKVDQSAQTDNQKVEQPAQTEIEKTLIQKHRGKIILSLVIGGALFVAYDVFLNNSNCIICTVNAAHNASQKLCSGIGKIVGGIVSGLQGLGRKVLGLGDIDKRLEVLEQQNEVLRQALKKGFKDLGEKITRGVPTIATPQVPVIPSVVNPSIISKTSGWYILRGISRPYHGIVNCIKLVRHRFRF